METLSNYKKNSGEQQTLIICRICPLQSEKRCSNTSLNIEYSSPIMLKAFLFRVSEMPNVTDPSPPKA